MESNIITKHMTMVGHKHTTQQEDLEATAGRGAVTVLRRITSGRRAGATIRNVIKAVKGTVRAGRHLEELW